MEKEGREDENNTMVCNENSEKWKHNNNAAEEGAAEE